VNDQALRWPLLLPLALGLGAAAYMTAPDEPECWVLGFAAGAPSVGWLLVRSRGARLLALAIAFVACAGIGALAAKVRSTLVAAPILKEQIGPVRVEGIIAEIDASERSRRVRIDVGACVSRARLMMRPSKGEAIEVDPCAFVGKGGAR